MASAVADLEAGLTAMAGMKPPGVSGSRISSLTSLCVANVQSESVLVQKLYTHFKKAASTHKLGTLYVVDSVTRKWLEQAKQQGQTVSSSAPDGSFAAGVHRVTELMPVLMNDIISSAPVEQKEKIKKLLDIWDKGNTFPRPLVEGWKQKLAAGMTVPGQTQIPSSTPPGSPPVDVRNGNYKSLASSTASQPPSAPAPAAPAAASSGSSILEALAKLASQKNTPAAGPPQGVNSSYPPTGGGAAAAPAAAPAAPPAHSQSSSVPPPQSAVSYPPPVNMPYYHHPQTQAPPAVAPPPAGAAAGYPGLPPAAPSAAAATHAAPPPPAGVGGMTTEQMQLIQALIAQGMSAEQLGPILQTMLAGAAGSGAAPSQQHPSSASAPPNAYAAPPHQQPWQQQQQQQQKSSAPAPNPRDRFKGVSPPRFGGRSRSRSPDRGWGGSRDRGLHAQNSPRRGASNEYRQRSPSGRRVEDSPSGLPHVERYLEFDSSLPPGCIRVYSRTLFVGGVTVPEAELRRLFNRFGTVQTCIVNRDKRHAFVKMLTRKDAVAAKESTESNRDPALNLRTRWGVGFGPRDCSDYATGISVIPIAKLTEADRKWMLNAPYGGSGGRPIEAGMCVEEPDIEIGAGVSSKAISRRMQTDKGGSHGPKSTRDEGNRFGRGRDRGDGAAAAAAAGGAGGGHGMMGNGDGFGYPEQRGPPTRWQ